MQDNVLILVVCQALIIITARKTMEKAVTDDHVLRIVISVSVHDLDIRVVRVRFTERTEDKGSRAPWDDVDLVVLLCIPWARAEGSGCVICEEKLALPETGQKVVDKLFLLGDDRVM